MLRFYTPSSGVIRVDGQDIQEVTVSSLRRHVAMIPQEQYVSSLCWKIFVMRVQATDEEVAAAQ